MPFNFKCLESNIIFINVIDISTSVGDFRLKIFIMVKKLQGEYTFNVRNPITLIEFIRESLQSKITPTNEAI